MLYTKKPIKTVEIKDQMTWWLNKNRPFIVGDFELRLLAINHEDGCVKILIKNLKNEQEVVVDGPSQSAE